MNDYDFADDIFNTIEEEHGEKIYRIARFNAAGSRNFDITIVFEDYSIFEGKIKVEMFLNMPSVRVQGHYY